MKKASRSLQSALNLLEDGDNDFATARAYYAVFYAAKAALISQAINRSKHSGVIAAFGQTWTPSPYWSIFHLDGHPLTTARIL